MRTLREVLLTKHEHVVPDLDRIRRQALKGLRPTTCVGPADRLGRPAAGIWSDLFSGIPFLRGQLAIITAILMVSACLTLISTHEQQQQSDAFSSAQLFRIAAENRKELLALIGTTNEEKAPPAVPGQNRPRSAAALPTRTI